MEVDANLNMVENSLQHCYFIIDIIVSDNSSKILVLLNHQSIDVRGQVLKSSKGKFGEEIPILYFFTNTPHQVNVVDEHILSIVNYGKEQ